MSVLVILLNTFSNAQENTAANGFCKTPNHWSHEHGVRGQEYLCVTFLQKVSQKPQTTEQGLHACPEGTFLSMICALTMVMLQGKRSTAGHPGQPPLVTCYTGTPNVCTGRKLRGTHGT